MTMKPVKDELLNLPSRVGGVEVTIPIRLRIELGEPVFEQLAPAATAQAATVGATARVASTPVDLALQATTEAVAEAAELAYAHVANAQWVDLSNSAFRWTNALAMAACSHLAYSDAPVVRDVCQTRWILTDTHFVNQGQTQCFIAAHRHALIVAFRGTKEFMDWFTNLNVLERRTSLGSVHDGFYQAFLQVSSQLEAHIQQLGSDRPLVLTGHSLGGALATLAAAFWRGKYNIASLYTYGQPCVGFSSFQAYMNAQMGNRYYRFVNADDIVPRVPPRYVHAGQLVRFDAQGNTVGQPLVESTAAGADEQAFELLLQPHIATGQGTVGETIENAQPPALTPLEFAKFQAQLEAARLPTMLETAALPGTIAEEVQLQRAQLAVSGGLEGLFPNYFSDHRMTGYLSKIMRHSNP